MTQKYFKNAQIKNKFQGTRKVREIEAEKRKKPEPTVPELVGGLLKEGLISRGQAKAILGVKTAQDFQEYCQNFAIN